MNRIENLFTDYKDIVEYFSVEKIEKRLEYLLQSYNEFIEGQDKEIQNSVRIDNYLIGHALMDYFTDIYRLKEFHDIETTNYDKVFSYEIYWLLKRKPIQLIRDEADAVFLNENFLTIYFLSYIFEKFPNEILNESDKYYKGYINTFVYYLKFREVTPQFLELLILSFRIGCYSICIQEKIDHKKYI